MYGRLGVLYLLTRTDIVRPGSLPRASSGGGVGEGWAMFVRLFAVMGMAFGAIALCGALAS